MLNLSPEDYFSSDFNTAKNRFQSAVKQVNGTLSQLPTVSDHNSGILATDIAWFGSEEPENALIVASGIHGVEGFSGSAIQLAAMEGFPELPPKTALVMVHILNPYGMANLRRFNGNNVDLNRNFHFSEEGWKGEPKGYAVLDSFLNPPKPPTLDFFHLKFLMAQFSLGEKAIKKAVALGQYRYPKGLFYGGNGLEGEADNYIQWFNSSPLINAKRLAVIDLHTGLGKFGEQSVFLRSKSVSRRDLSSRLGIEIASHKKESKVMGYDHGGGSSGMYRRLFNGEELVCLTVEYGTYPGRRLLYALRAENQLHQYGDKRLDHWAKQKLKEAFSPKSKDWRNSVVLKGVNLVNKGVNYLQSTIGPPSSLDNSL